MTADGLGGLPRSRRASTDRAGDAGSASRLVATAAVEPARPPIRRARTSGASTGVAVAGDVGSTFTKVAAVDLATGALVATAERPTTVDTDVLDGLDAAIADLGVTPSRVDVCSSAGGGLRLAVVGNEELVTVAAGQKVALSAGARVVHVTAGRLDRTAVTTLAAHRPDVILLVGGTDGGDEEVLRHNAAVLARSRGLRTPIVVAGNADVRDDALALLGPRAVGAANVLPRIGELNPEPARTVIRDVFLRHVIGGKHLSRGRRFASLVRGPTPDLVLTAVTRLATVVGGDVLVVDVGGATTDVYSAIEAPDGPSRSDDVSGTAWHGRTVEGDLGVRASAPGIVDAAQRERLLGEAEAGPLLAAAQRRAAEPTFTAIDEEDRAVDVRLAELAARIAVRRHVRGRDLRRVRLVVGSGGVLRHIPGAGDRVLRAILTDHAGGWAPPESAQIVVDSSYVLAPAGLLAAAHPAATVRLLTTLAAAAYRT
jgi:uncharacterized protein (TIGR01319 family)